MNITILGAGSWGTALSHVLSENGHHHSLWSNDASDIAIMKETGINQRYLPDYPVGENVTFTDRLEEAVAEADLIIIAVPSQVVRLVLESTKGLIKREPIFVNVSKGIEIKTLKRVSEIVEEYYPRSKFACLSGPSHAEEVIKNIPTTLVSASEDREIAEMIQDLFSSEFLRVYTNPDVIGVELGGALKNIIALGAGMSDGLGFGDNSKAALMTRGIIEMARLGKALNAKEDTFKGLSGIGDLIVTCTSMHSRNRRCGILIGEGMNAEEAVKTIGMVVEGYYTVKSAHELAIKMGVEMPITHELYMILYENKNAKESVKNLMLRSKKHEAEELVVWSE